MIPGFLKKFVKPKDQNTDKLKKLNPGLYLNQNLDYKPYGKNGDANAENNKLYLDKYESLLSANIIDLKELRTSCHEGIPKAYRAKCWKLLSDYLPPNLVKYEDNLELKRKEYARLRHQHCDETFEKQNNKRLQEGLSTIMKDVDRTLGETKMFQSRVVRDMLTKVLYTYHARNSDSGYSQGMNDILAPFIIVFTKEYVEVDDYTLKVPDNFDSLLTEEIILNIESDSYWCFTRLLSNIKNNYTPGFPGVLEMINKLSLLIKKLDPELDKLLKTHEVRYYDICFQWFLCLLLRQFTPPLKFRLLDFFFTDRENINEWMVYIGTAYLMKFSNKLKHLNAYDKIQMFFTASKTDDWGIVDLNMLLAEAHIYKNSYNYAELQSETMMEELREN